MSAPAAARDMATVYRKSARRLMADVETLYQLAADADRQRGLALDRRDRIKAAELADLAGGITRQADAIAAQCIRLVTRAEQLEREGA